MRTPRTSRTSPRSRRQAVIGALALSIVVGTAGAAMASSAGVLDRVLGTPDATGTFKAVADPGDPQVIYRDEYVVDPAAPRPSAPTTPTVTAEPTEAPAAVVAPPVVRTPTPTVPATPTRTVTPTLPVRTGAGSGAGTVTPTPTTPPQVDPGTAGPSHREHEDDDHEDGYDGEDD